MTTIALFGAAGKIGARITDKLRQVNEFRMLYVEKGQVGLDRLRESGLESTPQEEAARQADAVILAIPDTLIGQVATMIVPQLNSGTIVILLDPATAYSGELPEREDIAIFIVHPCHPPLINDEVTHEARQDFWGGVAKQNIVCALMQGSDDDYAKGEKIAREMFAPIISAHRISVEQMAILEPAMAETVILTCMVVMRESIELAIENGVPRQVAFDFALGHLRVNIGILFGYIDAKLSEGAKGAVERAKKDIFQENWERVFEPENVKDQVRTIVEGRRS